MTITKGRWKTTSDLDALVIKIKAFGPTFRWVGAIQCPTTGVWLLSEWDLEGYSPYPDYSLETKIETEKKNNETINS